jgi:PRTRC genetic system protein B
MFDEHQSSPLIDTYSDDSALASMRDDLRTTHALFFHTRNSNQLVLATAHRVQTSREGVPLVGPGRPLTPEDEQTIFDLLVGRDQGVDFEVLPPHVLYRDRLSLMWWLPAAVRPMHLRSHQHGQRTIRTMWPALVLLVRDRTLYLAALAGTERPAADTPLYHSPLPNVFSNGAVCTGTASLPLGTRVADLDAWTAVVCDTAFTHVNHDATLRVPSPAKGTRRGRRAPAHRVDAAADYWAGRDGTIEPFPDGTLNPMGWTLGQWLPVLTGAYRARNAGMGAR